MNQVEQPNVELVAEDEEFRVCTVNKYYLVSNYGRVYSLAKKVIKKPWKDVYYTVTLYNPEDKSQKTYRIHRLTALAWIPNPNNYPEVNHKTEDKYDNRVCMLEWCDHVYNSNYGTKNERCSKARSKTVYQYDLNFNLVRVWLGRVFIMKELGFCDKTIGYHCKHKNPYKGYYWFNEEIKQEVA